MDELRGWLSERTAGLVLIAVVVALTIVGRKERRY